MRRLDKKGVSPVIATVLLVMIVFILAVIIFLWARSFIKESLQKNERPIEEVCKDINLNGVIDEREKLVIVNDGNIYVYAINVKKIHGGESDTDEITFDELDGRLTGGGTYTYEGEIEDAEKIIIIAKILGVNQEGQKNIYQCAEEDSFSMNL